MYCSIIYFNIQIIICINYNNVCHKRCFPENADMAPKTRKNQIVLVSAVMLDFDLTMITSPPLTSFISSRAHKLVSGLQCGA